MKAKEAIKLLKDIVICQNGITKNGVLNRRITNIDKTTRNKAVTKLLKEVAPDVSESEVTDLIGWINTYFG